MKAAIPPALGTDDTLTTGVRSSTAAEGEDGVPGAASETMSGRRHHPPEVWDPDEAPESELPVPVGELLGGKYTVERMFAEGGMGIVCLGRHVQLDQPVAIKFLRRALSGRPTIVQRFLNEARALAALRSEHVVRVMDVGQLESGRPYLVMEHLEGLHLDALLERDGPLRIETAVSYVLQVCEPLAEAHALGIVHRDIKPENLFLWSGGPTSDTVKVLDFGLAKQLGSSKALGVTGPQDSLGSPCYMSPEQITTPQLVDSRTDVWSLGVVLYKLLSNTLPFGGNSLVEALSHILNAAPRPLPEVVPSLDAGLDAIVRRCLERAPEARYQTMTELADALNAYITERQGSFTPPLADTSTPLQTASPASADVAKMRIPGVHSRLPAALVGLVVLVGIGVYGADRGGLIRLRSATDGWLTGARLGADAPPLPPRRDHELAAPYFRGVFAADTARDANGRLTLRAVPELEVAASEPLPPEQVEAPMSDAGRESTEAASRDDLTSPEPTPLPEDTPTPSSDEAAEPSDDPYR